MQTACNNTTECLVSKVNSIILVASPSACLPSREYANDKHSVLHQVHHWLWVCSLSWPPDLQLLCVQLSAGDQEAVVKNNVSISRIQNTMNICLYPPAHLHQWPSITGGQVSWGWQENVWELLELHPWLQCTERGRVQSKVDFIYRQTNINT